MPMTEAPQPQLPAPEPADRPDFRQTRTLRTRPRRYLAATGILGLTLTVMGTEGGCDDNIAPNQPPVPAAADPAPGQPGDCFRTAEESVEWSCPGDVDVKIWPKDDTAASITVEAPTIETYSAPWGRPVNGNVPLLNGTCVFISQAAGGDPNVNVNQC